MLRRGSAGGRAGHPLILPTGVPLLDAEEVGRAWESGMLPFWEKKAVGEFDGGPEDLPARNLLTLTDTEMHAFLKLHNLERCGPSYTLKDRVAHLK